MKNLLTERELEVLELLIKGMNNSEISEILHVSVNTTKAHLESIYDKLGVKNRVQACIKSLALDIINLDGVA